MQRKEVRPKICMRKWSMEKQWTFPWKKLWKLLQRGLEKSTTCMSSKPQLVSFKSNGLEDVNTSPFTVDDKDSKILSETQFTMVTLFLHFRFNDFCLHSSECEKFISLSRQTMMELQWIHFMQTSKIAYTLLYLLRTQMDTNLEHSARRNGNLKSTFMELANHLFSLLRILLRKSKGFNGLEKMTILCSQMKVWLLWGELLGSLLWRSETLLTEEGVRLA